MFLSLFLAGSVVFQRNGLEIGSKRVELIPPSPFSLGGYTARASNKANESGEPLYARIVQFRDGDTNVVMVSCDLLTIPESLVREVQSRIPKEIRLFLAATHTHSAPDSQMLNDRMTFSIPGIAKFEPEKLNWYAKTISDGIVEVDRSEHLQAQKLILNFDHVNGNRGRRAGAWPDSLAIRVRAEPVNIGLSKLLEVLVWYTAHGTVLGSENNSTSGDWPGRVSDAFSGTPIFVGAIGDVSPKTIEGTGPQKLEQLTNKLIEALSKPPNRDTQNFRIYEMPRLDWSSAEVEMPPVSPNPEFARLNKVPIPLANSIIAKFAPQSTKVSAVRIGKMAIVGIPGEPTSALGRRIRDYGKGLGFEFVLVTSHVNGWAGYILEREDYARGGYEASLAFHGPTFSQKIYEASAKALKNLAYPSRGVKSVSGVTQRQ